MELFNPTGPGHFSASGSADFSIRVSRRARRLQMRVTPLGQVEVVVPSGMHPRHIPPFVHSNRRWIDSVLTALELRRRERPHLHTITPDRISLPALQRELPVIYQTAGHNRVWERDGQLLVRYRHREQIRQLLRNWSLRLARRELLPWLRQLSLQCGLEYQAAAVRRQKTLWGSCTRDGRISLNCNLLFLPSQSARYVMIHELCHTRHCNHSRRFWALVGRHEPDYQRLDTALREAAKNIPVWGY